MVVEAELGGVREVGAELEEEGAEVSVAAVEVVNVDHGGGVDDPGDGAAGVDAFAGGTGDADFLLGDADEEDAFILGEGAEFLLQDVVLALTFLEADPFHAFALDEGVDGFEEGLGHVDRLLGGGEAAAEVTAAEGGDAGLAGELGDIGVEIHPVEALQLQDDVIFLELGQAVGCAHDEFRLGFCAPEHGVTAACRQSSGAARCRAARPDSSF